MNANQQIMLDDSVTDSKVDTDKKSPRLEAKSSVEWQQQISANTSVEDRVANLEGKLAGLGRLVG